MAKRSKAAAGAKRASKEETGAPPSAGATGAPPTKAAPAPPSGAAPAVAAPKGPVPAAPSKAADAKEGPAAAAAAAAPSAAPVAADRLIIGWLRDHGAARHAFRTTAEVSYYLKIQTRQGEEVVWGKGLERALATSRTQPQIGDEIGVREIEIRPIALPLAGGSSAPRELPQARTHWVVERSAFFAERAAAARALRDPQVPPRQAIREHPDLLGAYFTLDSARKVAESRIGNAESRERFVALVRETLAHAAERGEPLPSARLRAPVAAPAEAVPDQRRAGSYGRAR